MRLIVLSHGLSYGGAQFSTVEFLSLIRNEVDIDVLTCNNADSNYIMDLKKLDLKVYMVPCRILNKYPDMDLAYVDEVIRNGDVVWVVDQVYPAIPRVKLIKDLPIIIHLHDYALICPLWKAYYGLAEICLDKCNAIRMITCRMNYINKYIGLGRQHFLKGVANLMLSPLIGFIRYIKWPMHNNSIFDSVDAFISVSKATLNIYSKHLPEIRNKPHKVIYNPILISDDILSKSLNMEHENRGKYTIFMSSGNPVKGPHILAEAIKYIDKEIDVKVIFARCKGTWVEKYIKKIGVEDKVILFKRLDRKNFLEYMINSNVVAMPSIWPEPYGRVAAEANFLGIPVVASRIGGLTEIIEDSVTGYLVEPNNALSLAMGIIKLYESNFSRIKIHKTTSKKLDIRYIKRNLINFFYKI